MKTNIFNTAITNRKKIKFLYRLNPIELEPYYLSVDKGGSKVIYGRVNSSSQVKMFEFKKIFNIKILNNSKFSPIIPILPIYN